MCILVVEDEPRIVEFVTQGLEEEGYVVDAALDGRTGLSFALSLRRQHRGSLVLGL